MPKQPVQIDQLWRGRSSQPDYKQRPGQVKDAKNVRMDITLGAAVRNPTEVLANLETFETEPLDVNGTWAWEYTGELILLIGKTSSGTKQIHAWTLEGVPVQVLDLVGDGFAYLPDDPLNDLAITTSADTTMVANRVLQLQMVAGWSFRQSYNYIKNGHPNPNGGHGDGLFNLGFGAGTGSFDADTFDYLEGTSSEIRADVAAQRNDGQVVRVLFSRDGNPAGYYIYFSDDEYPTYQAGNSYADGETVIVNAADELFPNHAGNWYRVSRGQGPSRSGNLPSDADNGQSRDRANPTRWPHRLLYDETNGVVYWTYGPYKHRLSGSNRTNPPASVSTEGRRRAKDVAFNANRFWILGEGHYHGTRSEDFFNTFNDVFDDVTEEDVINEAIAFDRAGKGQRLGVSGNALFVSCRKLQFEYRAPEGAALTNLNGQPRIISRHVAKDIPTNKADEALVIVDDANDFQEFEFQGDAFGIQYTSNLMIHDIELMWSRDIDRIWRVGSTVYARDADVDTLFVHDGFLANGRLVQSAWSRFDFTSRLELAFDEGSSHYLVLKDSIGFTLARYRHRRSGPPGTMKFWPRIDRLQLITGTYDGQDEVTRFQMPGGRVASSLTRVIRKDAGQEHVPYTPENIGTDGTFEVSADLGGIEVYVGDIYEAYLVLSKLWAHGLDARGINVTELYVFHDDTTEYEVRFRKPKDKNTAIADLKTHDWDSAVVGQTQIDELDLRTGRAGFNSIGDAQQVEVILRHFAAGQAHWTGLQYWYDQDEKPTK